MKRLLFVFLIAALAVCFAHTYQVQVYQKAEVGNQVLQPGTYKVFLNDAEDKMTISQGKVSVEVPIKVEIEKKKFDTTTMRVVDENGKPMVREIRLGGSNKRLTVQ
jgi:hypothetical protein